MADNLIDKEALEAAVEGKTPESKAPEKVELSQLEQQASEKGWVPQKEWTGDPAEWRSAREFIERGEWIGKFRAKDREIEQIKQALIEMTAQNRKIFATGYQKAVDDLKAQRRQALREGNLEEAEDIAEKIEETKKALEEAKKEPVPAPVQQPNPEHLQWLEKNPWYQTDDVMAGAADRLAAKYAREHNGQVTATEIRDYVTKEIRKEFAHKFPKPKVPPQPDGEGRRSGNGTGKNDSFYEAEGSMTDTQRSIMKTILKTTGMTKEDYFKQFSAAKTR